MLQTSPAVHEHEHGESAVPCGTTPDREREEACHPDETEESGNHQAMSTSYDKPKQGPKNLAPVERVDGQDVKDEKSDVNPGNCDEKFVRVGHAGWQTRHTAEQNSAEQNRHEGNIDQRASGDAPQRGAGTWRRVHIGHSTERPENNLVGSAADLPARQGVTKFVKRDDHEQPKVFEHGVYDGRVASGPALDFIDGDQKPGPVEENVDSCKAEQADCSLASRHLGSLIHFQMSVLSTRYSQLVS